MDVSGAVRNVQDIDGARETYWLSDDPAYIELLVSALIGRL